MLQIKQVSDPKSKVEIFRKCRNPNCAICKHFDKTSKHILDLKTKPIKGAHADNWCPKYKDEVLPDEAGNCSLCGDLLKPHTNEYTPPQNQSKEERL